MPTKTYTNRVKATVWTPTVRMDFTSNRHNATCMLFRSLDSQDQRSACLKELHEIDAAMTARAMELASADAEASAKAT